jgi:hypothetical protein
MIYEYKCVSGPTVVSVRRAKERHEGVKAYQDIMNREAADGWEFVTMDEFHTSEPEGWLSRKRIYVSSKMLVFRRPQPVVQVQVRTEKAAAPVTSTGGMPRVTGLPQPEKAPEST